MLVLSRYRDESIYIGDDVVITIVDVRGDRVRLGIQAPPNVSVHRKEIYDAIAREKQQVGKADISETPKGGKGSSAPLEQKIAERRGKCPPVEIETPPVGFGGLSDVITQ